MQGRPTMTEPVKPGNVPLTGCAGCVGPGLFILVPFAITWIAGFIAQSLVVQGLLLIVGVVLLLTVGWQLGRQVPRRKKMAGVFCCWLAMTFMFAAFYAAIYHYSPLSFQLSRSLLRKDARIELDTASDNLRTSILRRHACDLLTSAADKVARTIDTPWRQSADSEERYSLQKIGNNLRLTFADRLYEKLTPTSIPTRTVEILLVSGEQQLLRLKSFGPYISSHPDDETRFLRSFMEAKTGEDVTNACSMYRQALTKMIAREDHKILGLLTDSPPLDIEEFVLLSTSISTTIGSADVQPGSKLSKYAVIVQAFLSVFMFGYAVEVLWEP
jgi:hypothetical protein